VGGVRPTCATGGSRTGDRGFRDCVVFALMSMDRSVNESAFWYLNFRENRKYTHQS
jgi:hypothetical protein